jgi:excisionase family DNA binding protein
MTVTMLKPPQRLATVKEACDYAKLGVTKLYAKIRSGDVRAFKHGRKTLIDLDSIDAMRMRELTPWRPGVGPQS